MVLGQAAVDLLPLLEGQMCDLLNSRNNKARKTQFQRSTKIPSMNLRDAMKR